MNNLIERYIYDVVRRLPESERAEVSKELEANIADMLPENPSEEDIIAVLTKWGSPAKLAEQYRQNPRYLIAPAQYDQYLSVMKLVVPIVAIVDGCVSFLAQLVLLTESANIPTFISELFSAGITGAVEGALHAVFWVTLGFFIAGRRGGHKEKVWSVSELPEIPAQALKPFSRVEIIVGMGLTVFFTGIFLLLIATQSPSLVVFVINGNPLTLFNHEVIVSCIPIILLLSCVSLGVSALKLLYKRWTIALSLVNLLQNILSLSLVLYMLHMPNLFHAQTVAFMNDVLVLDLGRGATGMESLLFIISGALVLAYLVDSIVTICQGIKENNTHPKLLR